MKLQELIQNIPPGYSEVIYNHRKYAVTRTDFNNGKSMKIFAKELGGSDFISFNYYATQQEEYLKPCEMPRQKVMGFLRNSHRLDEHKPPKYHEI